MKALLKAQIITGLRGYAAMIFTIAVSPVLNAHGVSFQTISIGFGVLYSILALAEIPTGISADIFGAKKASFIGGILQTLGLILFAVGEVSNVQIIAGFFLYGLGSSFVSGALSALMFSNAKNQDDKNFNSNHYFSSIEKVAVTSYIIASATVGILSEYIGRLSFLAAALFLLMAAIFVALKLKDQNGERKHHSLLKEYSEKLTLGFNVIKNSKQLRILLPVRMLHQVETILGVLWMPWIVKLGSGNAVWISVVATGSYLFRYLVNHYVAKRSSPQSYLPRLKYSLLIMALGSLICVGVSFLNDSSFSIWIALVGIWTIASARGAFLPAVQAIQHLEFKEEIGSTGLSVMNFTIEVMIAVSYFAAAPIIDKINISCAWIISFIVFVISVLFINKNK